MALALTALLWRSIATSIKFRKSGGVKIAKKYIILAISRRAAGSGTVYAMKGYRHQLPVKNVTNAKRRWVAWRFLFMKIKIARLEHTRNANNELKV